jgi:hypothetical protein
LVKLSEDVVGYVADGCWSSIIMRAC